LAFVDACIADKKWRAKVFKMFKCISIKKIIFIFCAANLHIFLHTLNENLFNQKKCNSKEVNSVKLAETIIKINYSLFYQNVAKVMDFV
jgi:hypothetical protein